MLASKSNGDESSKTATPFALPLEIASALPSDPFEQLDVARKITSIALSSRISALESESYDLHEKLAEKDGTISELTSQLRVLENSFSDVCDKLSNVLLEKENLVKENASLSDAVRKLQRDVSKLEIFRKTLMQSLREEEDISTGVPHIVAKPTPNEEDSSPPTPKFSSVANQVSDSFNSLSEDRGADGYRPATSQTSSLKAYPYTPRMTPPGSPSRLSGALSPMRSSTILSGSIPSSMSSSQNSSSSNENSSFSGRTRVDGKEFFRQVRSRLSYEQFGAFLANVKELNARKQTKEETLRKVDEIFGSENKDLYAIFDGLITRNLT